MSCDIGTDTTSSRCWEGYVYFNISARLSSSLAYISTRAWKCFQGKVTDDFIFAERENNINIIQPCIHQALRCPAWLCMHYHYNIIMQNNDKINVIRTKMKHPLAPWTSLIPRPLLDFIFRLWREIDFSPQLWDNIWPGNKANIVDTINHLFSVARFS